MYIYGFPFLKRCFQLQTQFLQSDKPVFCHCHLQMPFFILNYILWIEATHAFKSPRALFLHLDWKLAVNLLILLKIYFLFSSFLVSRAIDTKKAHFLVLKLSFIHINLEQITFLPINQLFFQSYCYFLCCSGTLSLTELHLPKNSFPPHFKLL